MRIVMMFDFPALSERIREIVPEADILTLSPTDPLDVFEIVMPLSRPHGAKMFGYC